jgi:hypothetical protein
LGHAALALLLTTVFTAQAQNYPRMGYVYPAGGRQGTTFQVTIGGRYLDGVSNVYVSGAGIQTRVIEHTKPLTQQQFNLLKEQLKELQDKRGAASQNSPRPEEQSGSQISTNVMWTDGDAKRIAEIRKKLANPPNRFGNPAIAETVTIEVAMAPDAEPSERELRLGTPLGLSNPLVFQVGQLPEFSQQAVSNRQTRFSREPTSSPPDPEMRISLPAIVNGQIMPGCADRFRFKAAQGQHLVVAAGARDLIPYLPDAVPGWFQATLTLFSAKSNELAYADHYRFHPDPVLYYEIPEDGEYVIEIRDSIYRGREDFVYRITVGELPFITSLFPLGGQAGAQTTIAITGWNLPVARLIPDVRDKGPGIYPLSVRKEAQVSNRVPFVVDTLPDCLEQEPNNRPSHCQSVTLPIIVNGHVEPPGDWDVFRFEGQAGNEIVAEVNARRLDSPLDSVLKLTDATGKQLAFNDDHEDKGAGLTTHHADSWLRAILPANGTYYLHLGDGQQKGGAEYGYRLRLSPPQPDFALRIVPSSVNARPGSSIPITVYALRKDGFSNEIALALKDAPRGFTLSGGRVPAHQDQVRLTLTVPPMPLKEPLSLSVEGRAMIQGQEVVRTGVPAEDMMQAFSYRHLVPAKDLMVAVTGRFMPRASMKIAGEIPARIPAGGTTRIQIAAPTRPLADPVELELSEPPDGITIRSVSPSREGLEVVLQSDAKKVKPGLKGNLIITATAGKAAPSVPGKPPTNQRRIPLATLPAIPFEIVQP